MNKIERKYYRITSFFTGLILIFIILLLQNSCNKKDDCIAPLIDSLTFRDSTFAVDYLVPTRIMTVHGSHFKDYNNIYINHSELNPYYMLVTDTTIIFRVPLLETNSNTESLSDSILVVKDCGNALLLVNILLAPPVITKISNEYAVAGDTLTIEGYYFNLLETAVFPGEIQGEIVPEYSDTVCRIIVPEGVTEEGYITLTSVSGSGSSAIGIKFHSTDGMLCNFDDQDFWAGWGGRVITNEADPQIPEANGYFYAGEGNDISVGSNSSVSLILPIRNFIMPDYTGSLTPDYFDLKFEVFAKYSWESGYYEIKLGNIDEHGDIEFTYGYNFEPWNDTIHNGSYYTPSWETITIPLSEFILNNGSNLPIQSYSQIRAVNYMQWLFVNPTEEEGGQYIDHFCVAMDNFRIIQVKNEE
jgi:hypothetical protein